MKFHFLCALLLCATFVGCERAEKEPAKIQIGDLVGIRGMHYSYVKGNVIDCKSITIDYLEGNITGPKTRAVLVNTMTGNIETGVVSVNVLHGDIIDGENVAVNVLIGRDFSSRARVQKKM